MVFASMELQLGEAMILIKEQECGMRASVQFSSDAFEGICSGLEMPLRPVPIFQLICNGVRE